MTAKAVLQEMMAKYAAMHSYHDQGVVLTSWPNKPEADQILFETFFRRPDHFRFEWKSHHPYPPLRHLKTNHIIWSAAGNTFSYTDGNGGIQPEENLFRAIAGATGVSKGAALTVSNMLLPGFGAFSLLELENLSFQENQLEQTLCYRICGRDSSLTPHEIFVGVSDFTLRRVSQVHPKYSIAQIRTQIRIDELIDDNVFRFQPEA